jgi:2-polyprenyl-3-methyl-5-hydroxy-6-metoxy-1,4-benzoquinol methylase
LINRSQNIWHTAELDEWVKRCDELGGIQHPNCVDFITHFELKFDTQVSEDLDPTSEAYSAQQVRLYEEIANRKLDQEHNEHAVVPDTTASWNPYGSNDIRFISKHTRTVLNAVMLADLEPEAWVLDVGCGWGLSTETIGFTGANVHAIDINRDFINLVKQRTATRSLKVKTQFTTFDAFDSNINYDMIFFYECLHHSVSVLNTLSHLSKFAKPNGTMIFAGEPVTRAFWKHWGMRLDPLSVYCMRKFGWFETGWSEDYIRLAFDRIGWKLWLIAGIGLDHGYIGLAVPKNQPDSVLQLRAGKVVPPHWMVDALAISGDWMQIQPDSVWFAGVKRLIPFEGLEGVYRGYRQKIRKYRARPLGSMLKLKYVVPFLLLLPIIIIFTLSRDTVRRVKQTLERKSSWPS